MKAPPVLLLFPLLCSISCGIDEYPVLNPPVDGYSSTIDKYFEFRSTEDNGGAEEGDYFRGFEIYYRFYNNEGDVVSSLVNAEDLSSYGFWRLTYYIDSDDCDTVTGYILPLIKISDAEKGKGSLFTIDFLGISDGDVFLTAEEFPEGSGGIVIDALPLRRGIEDSENDGFYKSFEYFDIGEGGDADVTHIEDADVYIALYAYSFGRYGITKSKKLYSELEYLGYIEITLPLEAG
ncbi:MAG: hypothetical protein JW881_01185 [Spirochaetales bacterium]|nr:hypothetical protein [Spirochaetales bacterium]